MSTTTTIIHQPTNDFEFAQIKLGHPTKAGSGYFTKITHTGRPLYIETPETQSKQGFVKINNKTVCDLLFKSQNEEVITWFENMETTCHKLLFENAEDWFSSALEYEDIASAFVCPLKTYKSGKFQICRCSVRSSGTRPTIVYDENENVVPLTSPDINENTQMVTIIEVCGISFTARMFRLDLIIKQVMIIDAEAAEFGACLIRRNNTSTSTNKTAATGLVGKNMGPETIPSRGGIKMSISKGGTGTSSTQNEEDGDEEEAEAEDDTDEEQHTSKPTHTSSSNHRENGGVEGTDTTSRTVVIDTETMLLNKNNIDTEENPTITNAIHLQVTEVAKLNEVADPTEVAKLNEVADPTEVAKLNEVADPTEVVKLTEVAKLTERPKDTWDDLVDDLDEYIPEITDVSAPDIDIKKPNQVYKVMYERAKKKAQILKNNAIQAILEANDIKNTYMIQTESEDFTDPIDSDISDIESELT